MTHTGSANSFGALKEFETGNGPANFFSLQTLEKLGLAHLAQLPVSVRTVLESLLRHEDGGGVTEHDITALAAYDPLDPPAIEIPYKPARVLLQDFTGVPAVVDLAAMRSAMTRMGGDPQRINPLIPVDLVIDHSVQVDEFGTKNSFLNNAAIEFDRNQERYEFLRWGQAAFDNFRVVPPMSGICHQVNLEYLATVAREETTGNGRLVFPDTLVGTDSHTTMIGGLGIVGWGVGGIEAEAVMLGQPLYMLAPPVVGVEMHGRLHPGATATDLVLHVTQILRTKGVVGKFVEFFGDGLTSLSVPDRATIANMAPEYGATIGFFPVDDQVLTYLRGTGRSERQVTLVERYYKEQGLFRTDGAPPPAFADSLRIDLHEVEPCLAGPKRPQDRVVLRQMKQAWHSALAAPVEQRGFARTAEDASNKVSVQLDGRPTDLQHGHVAIAAITSCTNTSNPSVMIAAGLLAQKARERGLSQQPWVKTSMAPGSAVVTDYLSKSNLLPALEELGFHVVGYGCTTCIGNSGPLDPAIASAVEQHDLVLAGVLSGNRNFEGRINPHVRANYLASPPLVVAYALAGTVNIDFAVEPIGFDSKGRKVMLSEIWPTTEEVQRLAGSAFDPQSFSEKYDGIETSNTQWNAIPVDQSPLYAWSETSTYIQEPPFFEGMAGTPVAPRPINGARVLAMLGDSTTTDHISPAGAIPANSPAGEYLLAQGIPQREFNSYGSRRGNDQVMTRGTFANIRLKNRTAPGTEGGFTTHYPSGKITTIYEAARLYQKADVPTIVIGGKDYGMGSSRDWAAKGTNLLGVRAVIAESFERIHRSNLVGMGVLPLQFQKGDTPRTLGLNGEETFDIQLGDALHPDATVRITARRSGAADITFAALSRLDTPVDVTYYQNGGILQTMLREFVK